MCYNLQQTDNKDELGYNLQKTDNKDEIEYNRLTIKMN